MNVNGKVYSWGDVDIQLKGMPSIDVQEISYNDEQEKEAIYGKGNKPAGYGVGNYKSEGKLSMLRDEYNKILDYCKSQGIGFYELVVPKIIVSYANSGEKTRNDVLTKVIFTKRDTKAAQGDKSIKVDIDMLIIGGIKQSGVEAL